MPSTPTLDATIAGSSSNTYGTLAEAETYFAGRVAFTEWTGSDDLKNKALLMACRMLGQYYDWMNWQTTQTQALHWPRCGMISWNMWTPIQPYQMPDQLKWAQFELAGFLMTDDRTRDFLPKRFNIDYMLVYGAAQLRFKDPISNPIIPDAVANMIPSWWGRLRGQGFAVAQVTRG